MNLIYKNTHFYSFLHHRSPRSHTLALILLASLLILSLVACSPKSKPDTTRADYVQAESTELNEWFDQRFDEEVARSPMTQTYFGIKGAQDQLDDASQLAVDEDAALQESWLHEMKRRFDEDRLDEQTALSYRLFAYQTRDTLATHAVSDHDYIFQHMSGPHSDFPSFMMNFHSVDSLEDAQAYIARLNAVPTYMNHMSERAEQQYAKGVKLPRFIYPLIREATRNVITGYPFTEGDDSPLMNDIRTKITALDIDEAQKNSLIETAEAALTQSVQPTYEKLLSMFARQEAGADDRAGAWKLPKGEDYYQVQLKHYTTTDLSPDEIHEIGLKDVARIQDEMRLIMKRVGFEGTLQEFFTHLRTDPQFTYSNDDAGRTQYITESKAMIDAMREQLDGLFITKPKADMIVKRVEPFREDSAFFAFYDQPALDGSRPGIYYINLKNMNELPIYQMQALAYHEGIPGHHMQVALAMELEGLPKFRTLGAYTAYDEGWALYSEGVPKELGLYTDPYQEFGQLSMEIFRSARLVVDTGIHHKKWTREQAFQYMMENTANSEGDIRAEVDRYIVWPGQATAYKIGMLKIQELRQRAEDKLGDKFDIRKFHDVILVHGSVPLTILEELVDDWIASELS